MTESLHHYINGERVAGESGRFGDVFNPATGEVAARVPLASTDELRKAVAAAKAALPGWAGTTPIARARVMFRFKDLCEQHIDELAELVAKEHGKILSDAKGSVQRGIEVVEFACGIPQMLKGEFSANVGTNIDAYSTRQPVGVCAGIPPFPAARHFDRHISSPVTNSDAVLLRSSLHPSPAASRLRNRHRAASDR